MIIAEHLTREWTVAIPAFLFSLSVHIRELLKHVIFYTCKAALFPCSIIRSL
jgi:hypothetical protein